MNDSLGSTPILAPANPVANRAGPSRRSLLLAMGAALAANRSTEPIALAGGRPAARQGATPTPSTRFGLEREGIVGGARYRIRIPARWNGTLVLYGQADPVSLDAADPVTDAALLERGYGLAGSALNNDFRPAPPVPVVPPPRPWPVEDAIREQGALFDLVEQEIGRPDRTIAWGNSLSGLVAAGLLQAYPGRFAAAMPRCGLLAGGGAVLDAFLDLHFTLEALLAPGTLNPGVVDPTDAPAVGERALALLRGALGSPAGRARVALAACFGQIPDRFGPAATWPSPTDYAARAEAQAKWLGFFVLALSIQTRANAAARAGGTPTSNAGVDYRTLFARAAMRELVEAIYAEAGLDVGADLEALNAAPRVKADPAAADYLRRYLAFDGRIGVPVLTLHETSDGAAIPANEAAYAAAVAATGESSLLRQVYVERATHCRLTPAELLTGCDLLVRRIDSGMWDAAALEPEALNAAASALGADANQIVRQRPEEQDVGPTAPSFVAFAPPPLLRPFDPGAPNPTARLTQAAQL